MKAFKETPTFPKVTLIIETQAEYEALTEALYSAGWGSRTPSFKLADMQQAIYRNVVNAKEEKS